MMMRTNQAINREYAVAFQAKISEVLKKATTSANRAIIADMEQQVSGIDLQSSGNVFADYVTLLEILNSAKRQLNATHETLIHALTVLLQTELEALVEAEWHSSIPNEQLERYSLAILKLKHVAESPLRYLLEKELTQMGSVNNLLIRLKHQLGFTHYSLYVTNQMEELNKEIIPPDSELGKLFSLVNTRFTEWDNKLAAFLPGLSSRTYPEVNTFEKLKLAVKNNDHWGLTHEDIRQAESLIKQDISLQKMRAAIRNVHRDGYASIDNVKPIFELIKSDSAIYGSAIVNTVNCLRSQYNFWRLEDVYLLLEKYVSRDIDRLLQCDSEKTNFKLDAYVFEIIFTLFQKLLQEIINPLFELGGISRYKVCEIFLEQGDLKYNGEHALLPFYHRMMTHVENSFRVARSITTPLTTTTGLSHSLPELSKLASEQIVSPAHQDVVPQKKTLWQKIGPSLPYALGFGVLFMGIATMVAVTAPVSVPVIITLIVGAAVVGMVFGAGVKKANDSCCPDRSADKKCKLDKANREIYRTLGGPGQQRQNAVTEVRQRRKIVSDRPLVSAPDVRLVDEEQLQSGIRLRT